MRTRTAAAALLLAMSACALLKGGPPPRPPLGDNAEVHLYLLPLPRDAERLSFAVQTVTIRRMDGVEVPLEVKLRDVAGGCRPGDQRLLAEARVPPGEYAAVEVRSSSAALLGDGDLSRLLVDPDPVRAPLPFRVAPGRAAVVWLALEPGAVSGEVSFAPRFSATLPPQTPPRAALYSTGAGSLSVVAVDRGAREVTGVIPVPGTPRGIALDIDRARAYVALEREEVVDVAVGVPAGNIQLSPGDGPGDLALASDGTLVVANQRSRSVAFVDPLAMAEVGRVPVGDEPTSLILDRAGRRAFVANRRSASITELDVGNRAVLATATTDPEPLRVALSRDGSLLYVVHRGSQYVATYAVPSLALQARTFFGLGATTIRVDPRTELLYVSRGAERRIAVLDPIALQQIDSIDVPGAVSYMAIDDAENTLLALVPERASIVILDLTSRRRIAEIPVGVSPYTFAFFGERL